MQINDDLTQELETRLAHIGRAL